MIAGLTADGRPDVGVVEAGQERLWLAEGSGSGVLDVEGPGVEAAVVLVDDGVELGFKVHFDRT